MHKSNSSNDKPRTEDERIEQLTKEIHQFTKDFKRWVRGGEQKEA